MTDHILHRRNLKAFMSVLAATLTTMGALVIIFFLDEKNPAESARLRSCGDY